MNGSLVKKTMMKTFLIIIVLLSSSILFAQRSPDKSKNDIIDIGSRLELFIDDFLIDKLVNTRMVLNEPKDEGEVLFFDKPWEGPFCGYATIINDNGKYRMYYRGFHHGTGEQAHGHLG